MQSKLLVIAARGACRIFSLSRSNHQALRRELATFPTGISADPAVHPGDPDCKDAEEAAKYESAKEKEPQYNPTKKKVPFVPSKTPFASSPKLESTEVTNQPPDPITQQKRNNSTITLDEVICVGIDGTPFLSSDKKEDRHEIRREQEEDDIEYFKHHRASPLSEIEFVDTRKPIKRAMDEMPDYYYENVHGDVVTWRPEQLDTAEDSLRRATEIWKQSAVRPGPGHRPKRRPPWAPKFWNFLIKERGPHLSPTFITKGPPI